MMINHGQIYFWTISYSTGFRIRSETERIRIRSNAFFLTNIVGLKYSYVIIFFAINKCWWPNVILDPAAQNLDPCALKKTRIRPNIPEWYITKTLVLVIKRNKNSVEAFSKIKIWFVNLCSRRETITNLFFPELKNRVQWCCPQGVGFIFVKAMKKNLQCFWIIFLIFFSQ